MAWQRSAPAASRPGAHAALVCAGLAAALGLRVALAGNAGARSPEAGVAFGVALIALAAAAGWRLGRPSLRSALIGAGGAAVLLAVPLALHLHAAPLLLGSPAGDLPLWAAVVTLVAVAEETLLRGALMDALLRRTRPEAAVLLAALAFAAMHVPLYGWIAIPLDVAAGVWLGGLRLHSGGAGAPATAHALADLATWWLR